MSELKMIITVMEREFGEKFMTFLRERGSPSVLSVPANGTASDETLDSLGIEATEKTMLFSFAYGSTYRNIMQELKHAIGTGIQSNGIALSVSIESVGGATSLQYLKYEDENAVEIKGKADNKVDDMEKNEHQLIIAIANQGYTELVMNAARKANASGGTVIHAKGTCNAAAEKFCKLSLADEKEMVFIIAKEKDKAGIMKAIMQKAGKDTPAHSVVFTMPVSDIVGIE